MMALTTNKIIRLITVFCVFTSFHLEVKAQNDNQKTVLEYMLYNNYQEAKKQLVLQSKSPEKNVLNWHISAFLKGVLDSTEVTVFNNESSFLRVLKHIQNSQIRRFVYGENDSLVIINLNKAYSNAKESQDTLLLRYVLYNMVSYLYVINEELNLIEPYLKALEVVSGNNQDIAFCRYYRNILDSQYNNRDTSLELKATFELIDNSENYLLKANILQMIGVFESYFNSNQEQALSYWKQAANNFEKVPGISGDKNLFGTYTNIAVVYSRLENKKGAFEYYYKAKRILPSDKPLQTAFFYQGLAELHKTAKNIDSTFYYLNKEKKALKAHYDKSSNEEMRNLLIKYQTSEKENQILEEQQRAATNRNWLIVACLALVLGTGIAVLLQKNTTKKRQLAENETLLKQQRVDNLLKEQELVSIDAMIAGQEKERQKVANELHDDLGSLMATIKLHFNKVQTTNKDFALENAQELLDAAYQKIRGIAHAKNSGVMSDQGLLPAIKKMALVITNTNALEVKVEDFGMGERLENSLELNLFRMIQELVANAIKHARATKVNIQLTQHDDNLNIIVEDNGKGFDRLKLDMMKTGMGLTNLEKRVEHLEGNFTVDSVLGKGTSILIDIPI